MDSLLRFFNTPWHEVPTVWIDTETTGKRPGVDRACQVGFARFERGVCVASAAWLVNPGIPIAPEATAIHGITDAMVSDMPTIEQGFAGKQVKDLLEGAQPGAYHAPFDQRFVPCFLEEWTWPWLDALTVVRQVDRFVKGPGRHKLEVTAARHGIEIQAHDALSDAVAAGKVFYMLAERVYGDKELGRVLREQRILEAQDDYRFMEWLAAQPPREWHTPERITK